MSNRFDLDSFLLLTTVSFVVAGIGFVALLAGIQAFLRLTERRRWLVAWSDLLRRLPRSITRARRGELLCLEGDCGASLDGSLLVSPIFRTSCVAYWVEVRGGLLSRLTHRQGEVLPFLLECSGGEPSVVINPEGADALEFPGRAEYMVADAYSLDGELARHLETCAVRLGNAEPLGITQGSLAPGQPCTVIGKVERMAHQPSPYRDLEGAVLGGGGTLLIAPASRRQLASRLRWQRWAVVVRTLFSLISIVGSLGIMVGAAVLQPWMLLLMALVCTPLLDWFVTRQRRTRAPALLWPAPPPLGLDPSTY